MSSVFWEKNMFLLHPLYHKSTCVDVCKVTTSLQIVLMHFSSPLIALVSGLNWKTVNDIRCNPIIKSSKIWFVWFRIGELQNSFYFDLPLKRHIFAINNHSINKVVKRPQSVWYFKFSLWIAWCVAHNTLIYIPGYWWTKYFLHGCVCVERNVKGIFFMSFISFDHFTCYKRQTTNKKQSITIDVTVVVRINQEKNNTIFS